jgi:predicted kinase
VLGGVALGSLVVAVSRTAPILILSGPPGVGKSTVAGILSARSPRAVHLESDAFFRFIRSGYIEPWKRESHEQNALVMRIVARAAAAYAQAGYFTIVDGIVIPGWFLEPLREGLREAGHAVAYAVLRAPLPLCVERVQEREGAPPIDAAAVEQIWHSFADLGELESHAVQTEAASPDAVADALSQRLGERQLTV